MKLKFILLYFILFFNTLFFGQSKKTNHTTWNNLKNAAHQIGFCVHYQKEKICENHLEERAKREKNTPMDEDVYYFEMKKKWATSRITEWSIRQEKPIDDFLILFDISQKFQSEMENDSTTWNDYQGFILINLKDTIQFVQKDFEEDKIEVNIKSISQKTLMENTLWREFMTGRIGRFSNSIQFDLIGKHSKSDFEKFRSTFLNFQEKVIAE